MLKNTHGLADAEVSASITLPNGAGNVHSPPINLGLTGSDTRFLADGELRVAAPAVDSTALPNGQTLTYAIEQADDDAFTTPETVASAVVTQTGADGAGAAASEGRFKPASTSKPYLRLVVTKSGAGNASGQSATIEYVV